MTSPRPGQREQAETECRTYLGYGRIRDGETNELRRCLDCGGSGEYDNRHRTYGTVRTWGDKP